MKLEIIRGFLKALKPIEGTYITVSTAFYAYEAKWKDENPYEQFTARDGVFFALKTRPWAKNWDIIEVEHFLLHNNVHYLGELIIAIVKKENPHGLKKLYKLYPDIENLGKEYPRDIDSLQSSVA